MAPEEREDKRGFKVQDRRRFTETGDRRDDRPDQPEPAVTLPPAPQVAEPAPDAAADLAINFTTFVISLSTQALAHLGEIPHPHDSSVQRDLIGARQLIDILGMLHEKTKGNLDRAEEQLLEHILYDLRMRYLESAQRG